MRSEDSRITWTLQIRDELMNHYTRSQTSQKVELMALMLLNPSCIHYEETKQLYVYEESFGTGKNSFTGRYKTYKIKGAIDFSQDPKEQFPDMESRRAFLRGAFLAAGSFTDPQKSYQFELSASQRWEAEELKNLMQDFGIRARIIKRRERFVVYLKDGTEIADILNVIGAHKTLMDFENIRILKEMRESVNRQVNCETANINKSVAAAQKQLEDIALIKETIGLEELEEHLRNICIARMEHPDVGMSELGNLITPPLGKSGVNHRLRKLSRMAEEIRKQ